MKEDSSYIKKCKVLVTCMTYNHSKYITDALNGFAMQKTDFPFVCLVMDDASTDGEQEVIRDFLNKECLMDKAEHYDHELADIVIAEHKTNLNCKFAIYFLKVNLYNTNKKEPLVKEWQAHCPYIALCEGDDYWIDPLKLQKQVDYMDKHQKCTLCFTNGLCYKDSLFEKRVVPYDSINVPYYKKGNSDYSFEEMLGLDYVPTASLLFRTNIISNIPNLPSDCFSGDTYYRLYATSKGYAHFIDQDTCVYNIGINSSITTNWLNNISLYRKFKESFVKMLEAMNKITEYQYSKCLNAAICREKTRFYKDDNDWENLYSKTIREYMSTKSLSERFRYYAFPITKRIRTIFQK